MELVYLWVEDYKNIHKQGFNFSPRFECEFIPKYDEDNNLSKDSILKVTKSDYTSIYTENINVSAIVGKNGSGKSSVLEILLSILTNSEEINYVLVFKFKKDNLYYKSNISIDTVLTRKKNVGVNTFIYTVDCLQDYQNQIKISKDNILKSLLHMSIEKDFELTSFMYIPTTIEINSKDIDMLFKKVTSYDYGNYHYSDVLSDDENKKKMYSIEDGLNQLYKDVEDQYHKFLIILFLNYCNDPYDYLDNLLNLSNLLELLQDSYYLSEDEFKQYILNYNETKNITVLDEKEKEIFLKLSYFYEFDFIDSLERNYNDLSHGERTLFGQFLAYNSRIEYGKNHIFLIDEGELSLHPNWQKRYIFELYNFLKKLDKNFHFIFTTHSPFLISDLPKENIIFLDIFTERSEEAKEEEQKAGNCKVLSHNEVLEKKQTFGANIHTLLSDSFFMKDGLMGELAKSKINEIKKIYLLIQNKKVQEKLKDTRVKDLAKIAFKRRKNRLWNIQKIIGEPYLHKIIKNYLDELEILFSDDNTLIDKELEEIEKRKKYLESLKK